MESKKKPFDKALYDKFDSPAKNIAGMVLDLWGYTVDPAKEDYEVDVQAYNKERGRAYHEVEVKQGWKDEVWPFSWTTIHIPVRKERLFKYKPLVFWVFNEPLNTVALIKAEDVVAAPKEEVSNKYVEQGELFFSVPIEKVCFWPLWDLMVKSRKRKK